MLFSKCISPTGITSTTDGIEQRLLSQILLQVAHLVIADSKHFRNGQMSFLKMTGECDKSMIFVATCANTANNSTTIGSGHTVILTITT